MTILKNRFDNITIGTHVFFIAIIFMYTIYQYYDKAWF